jgi:predicted acyltransferase
MAIASLICGIISFLVGCCYIISWVPSIAGIVLGILNLKNNKDNNIDNKNDKVMSIIGIVLSAIGLLMAVIIVFVVAASGDSLNHFLREYSNYSY